MTFNPWIQPRLAVGLAVCCLLAVNAAAQAPPGPADLEHTLAANRIEPETEEFRQATEALRAHIKKMRVLIVRYNTLLTAAESDPYRQEYNELLPLGHELHANMIRAALAEYRANPKDKSKIADMFARLVAREVEDDRYEGFLDAAVALAENNYPDPELPRYITMTALAQNRYDVAKPYIGKLVGVNLDLAALEKNWERELQYREQDQQGEPLPRVLLRTTKGNIELELFENQAPETVANFISLVESGFYDKLTFHRVAEHFAIQAGCPYGDGSGDAGYKIYSEATKPDARGFFRGTIGMALNNGQTDTAGSQFFITFLPSPEINGVFTAFGRITQGIETLGNLVKIDPDVEKAEGEPAQLPDVILSAQVLHKRDHPYEPNKVAP